jgi:PAP2 superfamily
MEDATASMIGASSARRPRLLDVLATLGWHAFTPVEVLALAFVVGAVAVGAFFDVPVGGFLWTAMVLSALLAVVSVAVVRITRLDPTFGRWLAGMSLTFCIYAALPPWLNGLAGAPIDPLLAWSERAVLGTTLAELLDPYVSDGWTLFWGLAYSLHLPLFFALPLLHHRVGRRARAERLVLTLSLAMYLGFVGYALFPALGPVGTMSGLRSLGSNVATETVASYGVALGTFPSLHAGICAAVAIDGWRTSRRWGIVFTLIAILIWGSTIYLRYHWLPDLLAGLLLVLFADALARRLLAAWPVRPLRWPAEAGASERHDWRVAPR